MVTEEVLGVREVGGVRKIEVSIERVVTWSLIFTNVFFVSYFFGKLFQWV